MAFDICKNFKHRLQTQISDTDYIIRENNLSCNHVYKEMYLYSGIEFYKTLPRRHPMHTLKLTKEFL